MSDGTVWLYSKGSFRSKRTGPLAVRVVSLEDPCFFRIFVGEHAEKQAIDECDRQAALEPKTSEDAPERCAVCATPIRKYLQPGERWYVCERCNGLKCEKCCDKDKP